MAGTQASKKVLITGANGLIGNLVYARLSEQPTRYDAYGLDRNPNPQPAHGTASPVKCAIPPSRLHIVDLADFDAVREAAAGMDVVVHLAAEGEGSAWDSLLHSNIAGTHNVLEASRLAGVKRVIYASSNQVVFGYRQDEVYQDLLSRPAEQIDPAEWPHVQYTQPTRPLNDYACAKVYGEALAHMYACAHGLSCICLRLGWVVAEDRPPHHPSARHLWLSQRDCVQLIERCINAPDGLRFDVFFGQSDNALNLVDIWHTQDVLGYAPQDRAEDYL